MSMMATSALRFRIRVRIVPLSGGESIEWRGGAGGVAIGIGSRLPARIGTGTGAT